MNRIAFSTLCLALLSSAASAAPPPRQIAEATQVTPRSTADSTAVAPADKKICKLLPSSYSHRSDKVCLTKDQWKQVDDEMRNN
jgi:hypothetical protein